MKRFAFLILPSIPAFGHLVPYDIKAFLDLAKGSPEKANDIAHFCSLDTDSVEKCIDRLVSAKGEDAAEKCGREIHEIGVEIQKRLSILPGKSPHYPTSSRVHPSGRVRMKRLTDPHIKRTKIFTAKTGIQKITVEIDVSAIKNTESILFFRLMAPFSFQVRSGGPSRRWFMSQL